MMPVLTRLVSALKLQTALDAQQTSKRAKAAQEAD